MATTAPHHPPATGVTSKRWNGSDCAPPACSSRAPARPRSPTGWHIRQNAHRWHRQWQQGGRAALRAAGRAGRRPKLDTRARRQVERALGQGALAHGFDSDLWTLKRVALVIERLTGVRHHPSHIWRILRAMGWSVQRPARRARERDEEAIARWVKQDWPRIRQKRAAARRLDRVPG